MRVTIKTRRDTEANWTLINPKLALGEMGIETDTKKIKFGDGNSLWNDLQYISAGSGGEVVAEDIDDRISELLVAGSGISLSYSDEGDSLTISASGGGGSGISNIVEDTTPQLGGNLDANTFDINMGTNSITDIKVGQWDSAYGWGDHSTFGYVTAAYDAAVPWTPNHTLVDGTRYLVNDLVYESGYLYRANFDNESLPVSNTEYWTNVGVGYRLNIDGRDIPNIPYPVDSVNGQTGDVELSTTDLDDFNTAVSGLLPVKNILAGDNININIVDGEFTVSVTGIGGGGGGPTLEEIQDNLGNTFLVASTGINLNYSDSEGLLTISTSGVSLDGHTHTSANITDFNSSVSGLLPVKNIISGSGIDISSTSGEFTISTTGIFSLINEEVDDRVSQLLVAGTGVSLTYNDASGILTIDNLHTEINVLSQEPQGFVNRTDSILSFDDSSRTFTIQPAISGGSYSIYVEGIKVVKSGIETVVVGSGTALNYIHFDTTPPHALQTKTTGFNFDTDVPIAFIHWNSDINQSTFFGEERHGIRMDSVTHKWIHNTFGIQYINGLSIGGYTLLGDGSSNTHAQIDISDGILYQEDIIINITNDNGSNSSNKFVQELSPIAYIPTYYHSGSTGQWVRDVATAFPLKYNATRAQYNLYTGGTWTTPNVGDKKYFAMWIVSTNDINDPILAILGQREDSSLGAAENNNNWNNINLTNIPTQEIRPLYRLIFTTDSTFTNTPKSSLQSILDIRVAIQSTVAGVIQNDHGSLFGLADDDHNQYVHIDNNRTISALHTFSNGLNASGLITATSGNFTHLSVNSTGVSLDGHTHTTSQITDFSSSVSGLLPVVNVVGSGYVNSTNSSGTFTISVSGLQPSGNYSVSGHTHTSSEITDFNSSVSGLLPSNIIVSNVAGITGATTINNIVAISQANYNSLGSYDPNTIYYIV